jgi:hypothetical protein
MTRVSAGSISHPSRTPSRVSTGDRSTKARPLLRF